MATIGQSALTLADSAKRKDPDGSVSAVVEILDQVNEVNRDMLWMEANNYTSHRTTLRTHLPEPAFKKLNEGTPLTKSTTSQVDEGIAILEDWCETDVDLVELSSDQRQYRLSEARAHLEGMSQRFTRELFYGNTNATPEGFLGFSPRYSQLTGASNSDNVISGGGTGSANSSVWLICWGDQTVTGIYPKGSSAGIRHDDKGMKTIETAGGVTNARRLDVYQDKFQWKCGLAVKDYRFAARAANIDINELVTGGANAANIGELMIKLLHRIPNMGMGRCSFYMNRTLFQFLDIQRYSQVQSGGLTYSEIDGKNIPTFRGVPIGIVDALLETEAVVV